MRDTFVWMGIVGGVALVLYLYYKALEYLEDQAERALEPKVNARADLGRVPLTLQRRTMLNDAMRRQNTERGE